ncbi:methyltransferase domain-containing protein [Clostridiaceae bacterium 35-E11]
MELTSCYFDQYQRYETVKRLVNIYKQINNEKSVSILDIGGAGQDRYGQKRLLIKEFLPKEECYVLDVMEGYDFPEYIKGNGKDIPFPNNSFDFVITNDTLEHVRPEKREAFIKELLRVTKRHLILTAPFYSEENYMAENIFNEFLINVAKQDHFMLKEHIENGLPSMEIIEDICKKEQLNYTHFSSGDIYKWLFMNIIKAYLIKIPNSFNLHYLIDKVYNENFYKNDKSVENGYREVIVISKDIDSENYYFKKIKDDFKILQDNNKNINEVLLNLLQMFNMFMDSELSNKKYINSSIINDKAERPSKKICKNNSFRFEYIATTDTICGVSCLFGTYNKKLLGTLKLSIIEKKLGQTKATTHIDLEEVEDNLWHEIKFPIFNATIGNAYEFIFETYSEDGLSIWMDQQEKPCIKILYRDFEIYDKNNELSRLLIENKIKIETLKDEIVKKNNRLEEDLKEKEELILAKNKAEQEKEELILAKDKAEQEKEELILAKDKVEQEKEELILAKDKAEQEKEELILAKDKAEQEKEELILEKEKVEQEKEELKKILKDLMYELS